MCIQLIERYSICKCLYYRHAVDPCPGYHPRHHMIQERTMLVGYCCPSHSIRLSEGSSLSTPTLVSDAKSDDESISSRSSGSTCPSSISPADIVDELCTSLVQHPNLKSLWPVLVHSVTLKIAEKHLRRFFKSYSRDLQKEAKKDLERRASRLVGTRAPYLSSEICSHYSSALESQQTASPSSLTDEKGDESDSEISDKSETKDIDQSTISQIEPVRRFLFDGPPFKCLQSNLENFVHRELRAQEPIHLQIYRRVRIRLQNLLSPWVTSKMKEGSTRLWWTCCCGLRSYDDYTELLPGGLEGLKKQLDSMATTRYIGAVTNDRSNSNSSSNIKSNISAFMARWVPQGKKPSLPQHRPNLPQTRIEQCHIDSQTSNQNHNFLLLCLPFMQLAFTVQHADVCRLQSDKQFFQLLRQRYTDVRGHLRSIFSLQKLTALHFAQFEIYRSQNLADVRQVPSIPPAHLKTEYDYLPMPAEFIPPVGSNLLLHLYEHPDHAEGTEVLFRKVPKKLRCRLEACPVKGSSLGWGIQFNEGLHWHKLLLYSFGGFCISFVVGVAWAAVRDDVQGGFGIAGVLLAFMGLVVSLMQAGLNR